MQNLDEDNELNLVYSKLRAIVFLVFVVPFGAYTLVIAFVAQSLIGAIALILAVPIALLYFYGIYRLIKRLLNNDPVVTINSLGIIDRRHSDNIIPWTTIKKMYIGPYGASTSLLIAFKNPAAVKRALGHSLFLNGFSTKAENMINAPGAQWGIQLGPLKCRTGKVLELCNALHARAENANKLHDQI